MIRATKWEFGEGSKTGSSSGRVIRGGDSSPEPGRRGRNVLSKENAVREEGSIQGGNKCSGPEGGAWLVYLKNRRAQRCWSGEQRGWGQRSGVGWEDGPGPIGSVGCLKVFPFYSERRSLRTVPVGQLHGQIYILQDSLWLQDRRQETNWELLQVIRKCKTPASRGMWVQYYLIGNETLSHGNNHNCVIIPTRSHIFKRFFLKIGCW